MRKALLLVLALAGLLTIFVWQAPNRTGDVFGPPPAAEAVLPTPTVVAVSPSSAWNDVAVPVTLLTAGFTPDASVTAPTISLVGTPGVTPLTDIVWDGGATMTATVPWGVDPGTYDVVVTTPGASATRVDGYTVFPGVGVWNASDLLGGTISQLLMKPGDANTMYALAYAVGLFKSADAGVTWRFIDPNVIGNADFVVDSRNPSWLYTYNYGRNEGLFVSKDEGSSWTKLADAWTQQDSASRQVFVSPHTSGVLFESAYPAYGGSSPGPFGLKRSVNGGASWTAVTGMTGIHVQCMAFDPTNTSRVALATSEGGVYLSTNGGLNWSRAATPSAGVTSLGMDGSIAYNPFKPGEVWMASGDTPGGVFRSANSALSAWNDVSPLPGHGARSVSFVATNTVYTSRGYSLNNGSSWNPLGPSPWYGPGVLLMSRNDTHTIVIGDDAVGIRKTTNGGATWPISNVGLTGLRCRWMQVSASDPLRVYANFDGPLGIYRSDEGARNWTFHPIPGIANVRRTLEDPFDPAHVFVVSDVGLFETTNTCSTWTDRGWSIAGTTTAISLDPVALDPHAKGRMLGAALSGQYGVGQGRIYSSTNGGKTWVGPVATPQTLSRITSFNFDPETTGTVWCTTDGSGVYKSTNSGASWVRKDPSTLPSMRKANSVALATYPQRVVMVQTAYGPSARSLDGGTTWSTVAMVHSGQDNPDQAVFVGNDSTRLYAGSSTGGVWYSSDLGTAWTQSVGSVGAVGITQLGGALSDGHSLVYAATNGGSSGLVSLASVASVQTLVAATGPALVDAGVYRKAMRPVDRVAGADRYAVAVNLARKGWDPEGRRTWTGVRDIVIASGDPGKEADPLCAAGLAGLYDAPVLLVKQLSVPAGVKSVIAQIAAKNPGLKVHIVGGAASVPDSRFNEIKAIPGVNKTADRLGGADRYAVSVAIARRMVSVRGNAGIPGVLLICAENPAAFFDALAVSPVAYAQHMPMLAVRKAAIPTSIASLLSGSLKGKPRFAASSPYYLGASASGSTRLTASANRYTAATNIAGSAAQRGWLDLDDVGLAAKLSDSLTGGVFMGRRRGPILFTDSTTVLQAAPKSFISAKEKKIGGGWVFGGTASVTASTQTKFAQLLP